MLKVGPFERVRMMLHGLPLTTNMVPWTVWLASVLMNGTRQFPAKAWLPSAASNTHDNPAALIIRSP